jgi:hypothetical protein
VIDKQDYHGTEYSDQQAVEVQSGDPGHSKGIEEPAANNGTDYTKTNVQNDTVSRVVDHLAGDETSDQTQNDPSNDCHVVTPRMTANN